MSSINEQTRYQWTLRDEKRVIRLKFYTREIIRERKIKLILPFFFFFLQKN